MLLKTILFTLLTIYCATVLASKYSITITSEDTDYKSDSDNIQGSTPQEVDNQVSIHIGDGTDSTELLQEIFKANSLQFTDVPDSPTFFKAKNTRTDFDLVKGMFPDSLAKMDDPSDFMDIIMKDGRFANVRHIIKEIIEDIDEDEDEDDEEDTSDFFFEGEEEYEGDSGDDDDQEENDEDFYFLKEKQLVRKDNKYFTQDLPISTLLKSQTILTTTATRIPFFDSSNSMLYNISTVKMKKSFSITPQVITTHFPSRLFVVTSKNNPNTFKNNNNTIPEIENNSQANKRFNIFKPYYLIGLLSVLVLLIFDQ